MMIEFKSTAGYPYVEYLSSEEFVKGDSYTFTCRFISSNSGYTYTTDELKNIFIIWGANQSGGGTKPVWANMPGFSIAYDSETKTVTAHFTAGNDSVNGRTMTPGTNDYIQFRFGDRSDQLSGYEADFTDFSITWVSTGTVTAFPLVTAGNVYNTALAAVLKFMRDNPDTLLIITSDHETGGVTIPSGSYTLDSSLFTTTKHTAANVRTFAVGYGAEYFNGVTVDNTDVGNFAINAIVS